ncbi:MotA/TolQ/ExbB proton channel family protein [Sinimarinibacterium sp. CAU 1509]|uniref:MotA/TolQ/ExbB proton channel family protein n=1 Tax=Sinimarinibacterium sp. CAU 1509 TaxID=2562283 RepID=UPI0010ABCB1A|nr:MotA/TolQ/ExbB proton channel family protein [Sinimarinibacterium sp. CAU 1509]TJY56785.1 MotA/TolQ/ExbB proton channel family protein [Sinimarinibacterium sp. CAU 1509]
MSRKTFSKLMRGAGIALLVGLPLTAIAAGSLDELLEQTRTARAREAQQNQVRVNKFQQERDKRSQLLAEAKAALAQQNARANALSSQFDANEKKLTEVQAALDAKLGNLGEMFGVVRQVAGDFASVAHNSMISAQFPEREAFAQKLSQSKSLASIDDLEKFWFEMQREMTESGRVAKFNAKVINAEGVEETVPVVRLGGFTASTDDGFVNYLPGEQEFAVLSRQPASRYVGPNEDLMEETSGYHKATLDPTRGTLLSILVQTPKLTEQVKYGGLVGYLILAIGAIGLAMAAVRLVVLSGVGAKVKGQRKNSSNASDNNPLGRVLAVYYKDPNVDKDTLQLRLDEAVLREIPALESWLPAIKMIAAVGPLMGLLGTVTGMILTFQQITLFGTGDPKIMADGISQALVTTVLGLVVAIPMVLIHAYLSGRSKDIVQILDEEAAGIIAEHAEKQHGRTA